jgi:hypothetical protein
LFGRETIAGAARDTETAGFLRKLVDDIDEVTDRSDDCSRRGQV